jgi:hypothetical protein
VDDAGGEAAQPPNVRLAPGRTRRT